MELGNLHQALLLTLSNEISIVAFDSFNAGFKGRIKYSFDGHFIASTCKIIMLLGFEKHLEDFLSSLCFVQIECGNGNTSRNRFLGKEVFCLPFFPSFCH